MEKQERTNKYGLLGRNISYSFSKGYFAEKFDRENIQNCVYQNFDINQIDDVKDVFSTSNLKGLNVTIPYKEQVIPFLDSVNDVVKKIGAVNTIQFKNNQIIGHNTDAIGFQKSIEPLLKSHHKKALILGTGGASKAVEFVFNSLGIEHVKVSRNPKQNEISYQELTKEIIDDYTVIVNCTPLGTFPNIDACPDLPYHEISSQHLLYDLIYNPSETKFLQLGKQHGSSVKNGLEMLQLQAEAAWEIWNS